ncbi:hypothetical protein D3C71_1394820 [compost metagenome]
MSPLPCRFCCLRIELLNDFRRFLLQFLKQSQRIAFSGSLLQRFLVVADLLRIFRSLCRLADGCVEGHSIADTQVHVVDRRPV